MGLARNVILGILLFIVIILSGSYAFSIIEGYSLFDSFENVFYTITTVGMMIQPQTMVGHVLMWSVLFFGMGTAIYIATSLAKILVEGQTGLLLGDIRGGIIRMRTEKNHVIVCGYGALGAAVCDVLKTNKEKFVVIDPNEECAKKLISKGYSVIQGDALDPHILKKAGVERAKSLIASLGNDAKNIYLVMTAAELNSEMLLAAEASEEEAVKRLHKIGAQIVVLPQVVGGRQLAQAVLEVDKAETLSTVVKKSKVSKKSK